MLSVIIPSRNMHNLTACIDALHENDAGFRLIVIDDGLQGIANTYLDSDFLIPGVQPFVFARNVNIGILAAGRDDVIVLNDDALLRSPGGFTGLRQMAREHQDFGLFSATTNVAGNARQYPQYGHGLLPPRLREEPQMVCFVCVLIPRTTIDRVGMLDERFVSYGWEDNDYCRRVREDGMKIGIYDGCYVDHGSLRSTFRGDPLNTRTIVEGAKIYAAKWGDLE